MMRMFKIELPVRVQEIDLRGNETEAEGQNLTVRITMGDKATCKDAVEALAEADRLRSEAAENGSRTIVLLGAKVCSAFGLAFMPFTVIDGFSLRHPFADSGNVVRLPHPSGLSRAWGDPGAFERARTTLREAGVLT